jgi:high-affinity Fe2+/Pb2+ permease
MSFRNIIAIVLAIVVGYFLVKVVFAVVGFVASILWFVVCVGIVGGVVYMLYRAFNNMLTSGKRLT